MYELIRVSAHDAYIDCPAKMGVVDIGGGRAVMIDGGSDKDAGKKALKALAAAGLALDAVLVTHAHADHIGGCHLLQDRTGCRVLAPGIEAAYTAHPILEPAGLYGGLPFKELRGKFLMAEPSRAERIASDELPGGLKLLALPGHAAEQAGYLTPDGTAYIGDAVSAQATLEKYGICYLWDVEASLKTLETLPEIPARRFISAHADPVEDIAPLARLNADAIRAAADRIEALCAGGIGIEALVCAVFKAYDLPMNAVQYALIGSTVRSYLSYLRAQGRVDVSFDEGGMRWTKV